MNLLLGLVPWWARWLAIAGVLVAAAGWGAAKMHAHDEARFEAYRAEVRLAGERQNERTQQIVAAQAQLKEISDAEWKTKHDAAVAALADARLRLDKAGRDRRFVPGASAGAGGGARICFPDRDELDRGIRERFARLSARIIRAAEEGQRGTDIAAVCSSWAKQLPR